MLKICSRLKKFNVAIKGAALAAPNYRFTDTIIGLEN